MDQPERRLYGLQHTKVILWSDLLHSLNVLTTIMALQVTETQIVWIVWI